jgi:hypothetical protein
MILRKTEAGNFGAISVYETESSKPARYRESKQNVSTTTQQRKNDRRRLNRQILRIDKNFTRDNSAFYLLTFRRKDKDPSVAEALKHFENFARRLRRHFPDIRYSAVLHLGSRRGRPHFHIIVTCTNRAKIVALWKHGRIFKKKIVTKSMIRIVKYMHNGTVKTKDKSIFINSRNLVEPCTYIRETRILFEKVFDIIEEAGVDVQNACVYTSGENPSVGKFLNLYVEVDLFDKICELIMEMDI